MAESTQQITLIQGSTRYPYRITGPLRMVAQADQAQQEVTGEAIRKWNISDLSQGIGLDRIPGRGGSYRYNTGWDTRWPNALQLWPEALLVATINATDAPPTYNGRQGGVVICNQTASEDYQVFIQFGDRVVRITSPTAATPTATEVYNHGVALSGIGVGYNTSLTPTGETSVIVGDAAGGTTSWQETQNGTTWAAWSPGGAGDDPQNQNGFITTPDVFQLHWIEGSTADWRIQNFTEPNITGATTIKSIDKAFLRPRFLGLGIDTGGFPVVRYTENTPKRFAGIVSDMPINPLSVTAWYAREAYSFKGMIILTNPSITPSTGFMNEGRGSLANPNFSADLGPRLTQNIYHPGASAALVDFWLSIGSPISKVSETVALDRGQGLPTNYIGFLMALKARPDGMYMFLEEGTGDYPTTDPDGTQTTWILELVGETMTFHPIARFTGAAIWFGLAVTEQHIWALVKTGATQAKLYRIQRLRSPGIRGTDNFEPFSTGTPARLELPWVDFGQPQDAGMAFYIKVNVGTFTNMSLRIKYITDYGTSETTLGTLTAAGVLTFTANTTFTSIRLILEAWRSTGSTATDTIVLRGGIEFGYRKFAPIRARYVFNIDQYSTMEGERGGAVSHGRLLAELRDLVDEIVDLEVDENPPLLYSRYIVESIGAEEEMDNPNRGRRGTYRVTIAEANTS